MIRISSGSPEFPGRSHPVARLIRIPPRVVTAIVLVLALAGPVHAGERAGLRASTPEAFRPDIESLFAAVRRADLDTIAMLLDRLADQREARNIPNLSPLAAGLLPRLQSAIARAPQGVQTGLLRKVVHLAPDLPDVHLALSRAHLAGGFDSIGPAVAALSRAGSAWLANPGAVIRSGASLAFHLFGAIVLCILAVSLLLVVRYRRELIHDVGDLFPASLSEGYSASEVVRARRIRALVGQGLLNVLAISVTLILLALPLFGGLGLLGGALVWILVILRYARRSEVVASFVLIATIAALPLVSTLILMPRQFDEAPGPAAFQCLSEFCPDSSLAVIHQRVQQEPGNAVLQHALALHDLQAGPGELPAITMALGRLEPAGNDWTGTVQTFQGNLHLIRALLNCRDGVADAAALAESRRAYDAALKRWPSSTDALRGMSLVQGLQGDRGGREASLSLLVNATSEDELDFVARIRTLSGSANPCGLSSEIISELRIPDPRTPEVFLEGLDLWRLPPALPFGGLLEGRVPVRAIPWVGLICLVLAAVIAWSRSRLQPAYTCPRCNKVSCGHCNIRSSGFDYCPSCLFDQVRPAFVDPLDVVARQRRLDAQLARGRLLRPILALAIPGSGQILSGRPFRGGLMLLVLGIVISLLVNPGTPIVDVYAYPGVIDGELPLLPPVLLLTVYAWSAIDVWMSRSR